MTGDIKYSQKWGGRDIAFDQDEVQDMKKFSGAGMKLLGFEPQEKTIKAHQHVRSAQFIYPGNEKSVEGSTTLFSALLTRCVERNVVLICSLSPPSNSPPRLVALPPQAERIDEDKKEQTQSPGFHVIYQPFSEYIGNSSQKETKDTNAEAGENAEKFVRKLRFTYRPSNFDNPALQTRYQNLEAMALEKDEPGQVEDFTLPNYERITQKAGDLLSNFKAHVFPEGYDPTKKASSKVKPATKQKAGDANGAPSAKLVALDDVKEMAVTGKLAKLTVLTNGIDPVSKKKDLIDILSIGSVWASRINYSEYSKFFFSFNSRVWL